MKKYGLLILAILAVVVFASGCTSSGQNTYNSNGISFNYPGSWKEISATNVDSVAGVGDPNSFDNSTKMENTVVVIQKIEMPSGYTLNQVVDTIITQFASQDPNFQKISENTITVNGATAYEVVYKMGSNGVQKQEKAVFLEQNGNLYDISCSALPNDFDSQQANFDMVINSFKVQ